MKRVTLDTCVYVSPPTGGRNALRLLHMAIDGEIEIAISESIITETTRVLREKFDWPPYDLLAANQRLHKIGRIVAPQMTLSVTEDEPDNRVLELAQESGSEFIISEDKDLLRLKQHGGAKIVRTVDFLAMGRGRASTTVS